MCSMVMVPRVCPTLPWLINGGVHQTFTDLNDDMCYTRPKLCLFLPRKDTLNWADWTISFLGFLKPFYCLMLPRCFGWWIPLFWLLVSTLGWWSWRAYLDGKPPSVNIWRVEFPLNPAAHEHIINPSGLSKIMSITHRIHGAATYGVPWIPSIYPQC